MEWKTREITFFKYSLGNVYSVFLQYVRYRSQLVCFCSGIDIKDVFTV